jgi:hypothetical protein
MRDKHIGANALPARRAAWLLAAAALIFVFVPAARAQDDAELEGVNGEKYNVKQSVEFGGRFVSINGPQSIYDTFVNLQQGPRLLGFSVEMRSLDQHGGLFDRLYLNGFGYGGDPNEVSRLRVTKNKWYNFDVMLRHDENTWDYSLMANPLNPTGGFVNANSGGYVGPPGFGPLATSTCTGCVLSNSPHLFNTRRELSDYSLLVLPESKVRFRLGYSRNIVAGPEMTSYHVGTEQVLFDDVKTTVNTYRFGVDYRALPRTNISYDEIWNDYKGDTGTTDQNQMFGLSNGQLVDLGASLNAAANQPCAGTFLATGFVNPTCSGFLSYLSHGRVRTKTPTEQVSMQSNYWKDVDLSGRFAYTAGEADMFNYVEALAGRESRTNLSNSLTNGGVTGERVAATGDLGLTWHINEAFSFLDGLHYSNFHNPLQFDSSDCSFFSTNLITAPNVFAPGAPLPVTCFAPGNGVAGTPNHTTSAEPDLAIDVGGGFLKQEEISNLAEVDYQFSQKFGARVGFRYRRRDIDENSFANNKEFYFPSNANRGDCALVAGMLPAACKAIGGGAFEFMTPMILYNPGETLIHEYSGLFGLWARPVKAWRISFDTELMSADNVFTRISPRQSQEYRVRSTYKPIDWFHLSGSIRIWEGRDNITGVDSLQHDRSYGISGTFQISEKVAVDVSYDYNDVYSQILICYPSTPAPAGINKCPNVAGLVEQLSTYKNDSNFGGIDLLWKPVRHLTTHLGGNFTGTSGSILILNPNQEPGPLNSRWLSPTGGLDYAFTKNWMGRAYWNYYGYHEDAAPVPQDIFAPRNFHANTVTLSARYAF